MQKKLGISLPGRKRPFSKLRARQDPAQCGVLSSACLTNDHRPSRVDPSDLLSKRYHHSVARRWRSDVKWGNLTAINTEVLKQYLESEFNDGDNIDELSEEGIAEVIVTTKVRITPETDPGIEMRDEQADLNWL